MKKVYYVEERDEDKTHHYVVRDNPLSGPVVGEYATAQAAKKAVKKGQLAYIRDWAGLNRCYLDLEGEIGFGRQCVGVLFGDHYPAYGGYNDTENYTPESRWYVKEAEPPVTVTDAYHKGEYLAVLGRGDDAIRQLYDWVVSLVENDVIVEIVDRLLTGKYPDLDVVDLLFHGSTEPRLKVKDA